MSLKALTAVAAVLIGCKSEPDPVELPPPAPCGGSIPMVSEVVVFDNGPLDFGGEVWPNIRIELDATDPDGALTAYTIADGDRSEPPVVVTITTPEI